MLVEKLRAERAATGAHCCHSARSCPSSKGKAEGRIFQTLTTQTAQANIQVLIEITYAGLGKHGTSPENQHRKSGQRQRRLGDLRLLPSCFVSPYFRAAIFRVLNSFSMTCVARPAEVSPKRSRSVRKIDLHRPARDRRHGRARPVIMLLSP